MNAVERGFVAVFVGLCIAMFCNVVLGYGDGSARTTLAAGVDDGEAWLSGACWASPMCRVAIRELPRPETAKCWCGR